MKEFEFSISLPAIIIIAIAVGMCSMAKAEVKMWCMFSYPTKHMHMAVSPSHMPGRKYWGCTPIKQRCTASKAWVKQKDKWKKYDFACQWIDIRDVPEVAKELDL